MSEVEKGRCYCAALFAASLRCRHEDHASPWLCARVDTVHVSWQFFCFLAESWSIANMCCCLLLPLWRRCWLYSSSRTNSQTCVDSTNENRRKGKDAGTQKLNSARIWPCPLSDSCEPHTLHDQASARVQEELSVQVLSWLNALGQSCGRRLINVRLDPSVEYYFIFIFKIQKPIHLS